MGVNFAHSIGCPTYGKFNVTKCNINNVESHINTDEQELDTYIIDKAIRIHHGPVRNFVFPLLLRDIFVSILYCIFFIAFFFFCFITNVNRNENLKRS